LNLNEVHLTIVKNPVEVSKDREQRSFLYEPIPISDYLKKAGIFIEPGFELNVVYGGNPLTKEEIETVIPAPGDHFVTIPMVAGGGNDQQTQKQVLSIIASIALMYAGVAAGNMVAGQEVSAGMAGMQYWKTSSYLVSTMVQMAGGMLISRLINKGVKTEKQASATYGWAIVTNMNPGGAIQETCGTIRTGGTCLGYYVTTDGEQQFANILLSGGEGPCDNINIDSIEINGNSIKNFDGVTIETRYGTNNQTVIPAFNDTRFTQSWGDELKKGDDWIQHRTDGTAQALELIFDCPYGLCQVRDDGKFGEAYATIEIQYKKETESDWTPMTSILNTITYRVYSVNSAIELSIYGNCTDAFYPGRLVGTDIGYEIVIVSSGYNNKTGYTTIQFGQIPGDYDGSIARSIRALHFFVPGQLKISAHTPNAYKQIFTIDNLAEAVYDVRVRCISKSGPEDVQSYKLQTFWTGITQIIRDDLCYPNQILLAIKALASDKLNGTIQSVTWEQSISKCWVWNPNTQAYEQKAKDNPAWRAYDIYHKCRQLININTGQYEFVIYGEAASKMDYTQFAAWADFCDTYNLKCNYAHDTTQNREEALAPIVIVGRGNTFQSATMITCSFNGPVSEPVQVFNRSNTALGGITIEYLSKKNRANSVEIKFRDAERKYEWHEFPIYTPDYDKETGVQNPVKITLVACTSYNMAYRHGLYELKMNKYITKSASLGADVDAIASRSGDVIGIQNDITQWGKGGRIVEAGSDWVKLDQEVTFVEGQRHEVSYRLSDNMMDFQTATAGESADIIKVETPFVEDTHQASRVDGTHFKVGGDQTSIYVIGATIFYEYGFNQTNESVVVASSYNSTADETTVEATELIPDNLDTVRFAFSKPRVDDMYWFGREHMLYKLFKITSITINGELSRKISAMEYIPEVYDENEDIPPPVDWTPETIQIKNLVVSEHADESNVWVDLSWEPGEHYGGAVVIANGKTIATLKQSEACYSFIDQKTINYTITVMALDIFGNVTGKATKTYVVKGFTSPEPIKNLVSYIDSGKVWLAWDRSNDYRAVKYEIRRGRTWSDSQIINLTSENRFQTIANGTYWIAVKFSDVYSPPVGANIDGADLSKNIVADVAENPTWGGQVYGSAKIAEYSNFGKCVMLDLTGATSEGITGIYEISSDNIIDLGYAQSCGIAVNADVLFDNPGFLFSAVPLVSALESWAGNYGGNGKAEVQIAFSPNSGVFGEWKTFIPGIYVGRMFKFRVILTSYSYKTTAILSGFNFTLDVPDRFDKGTYVDIPVGGLDVAFDKPFHIVPNIQITVIDADVGDRTILSSQTESGFHVEIKNGANSIARKINWFAQGY
jgi:predicted phage tail protein